MTDNARVLVVGDEDNYPRKKLSKMSLPMLEIAAMMLIMYNMRDVDCMIGNNYGSTEKTYGSNAVKRFNPDEWEDQYKVKAQGRNEQCKCNSGKKFKNCCARLINT